MLAKAPPLGVVHEHCAGDAFLAVDLDRLNDPPLVIKVSNLRAGSMRPYSRLFEYRGARLPARCRQTAHADWSERCGRHHTPNCRQFSVGAHERPCQLQSQNGQQAALTFVEVEPMSTESVTTKAASMPCVHIHEAKAETRERKKEKRTLTVDPLKERL